MTRGKFWNQAKSLVLCALLLQSTFARAETDEERFFPASSASSVTGSDILSMHDAAHASWAASSRELYERTVAVLNYFKSPEEALPGPALETLSVLQSEEGASQLLPILDLEFQFKRF